MSRKYFDQLPAFQLGMRLTFNNLNSIIDLSFFFLVMSVTNGPLTHDFPIEWMTYFTWHFYTKSL